MKQKKKNNKEKSSKSKADSLKRSIKFLSLYPDASGKKREDTNYQ